MCKCDFKKCRKQCECRCHVGIEANSAHSYKLGQSVGMGYAGSLIMEMAVEAFRHGRQDKATMLREISEKLTKEGKEMHPGPDVEYEEIKEA